MAKKSVKNEEIICPVGRFFTDLNCGSWNKSEFMKHLNLSKIEFLKAIRSLVDERIESIEKKEKGKKGKKSTKIKVE